MRRPLTELRRPDLRLIAENSHSFLQWKAVTL
jgi:hypothetical protein